VKKRVSKKKKRARRHWHILSIAHVSTAPSSAHALGVAPPLPLLLAVAAQA
jgi:hypothetical protein